MERLQNEYVKGVGNVTISYGKLKEVLNLKDNYEIVDIVPIKRRQNVVQIVVKDNESDEQVLVGDIRPKIPLGIIQKK